MAENNNHITTRVDLEVKQAGLEFAEKAERSPAWVFARAIEIGLPEVIKRYAPAKATKRNESKAA